jgi:hypothetical protein
MWAAGVVIEAVAFATTELTAGACEFYKRVRESSSLPLKSPLMLSNWPPLTSPQSSLKPCSLPKWLLRRRACNQACR